MRVVLSFCANFALRKKVGIAIVYFGMSRASTVTGTYRFVFFIRIDGTDNAIHVFDREGVTVTIDGEIWVNKKKPEPFGSYSVVSVKSMAFVVTKPTVQQCTITFDSIRRNGINAHASDRTGLFLHSPRLHIATSYRKKVQRLDGKWYRKSCR